MGGGGAECISSLSPPRGRMPVYSADEKRATAGEALAGSGFRLTGEGTGLAEGCCLKAAKDWMAMLAKVGGFWGGVEALEEEAPSLGRLDVLTGCILSSIPRDGHGLAQIANVQSVGDSGGRRSPTRGYLGKGGVQPGVLGA